MSAMEQKLTDTNKQLEENNRPTLSGLGTRVEQILRLAEEQANDHRGEAKRESEGIISAARLEAREITDKARAEAAARHENPALQLAVVTACTDTTELPTTSRIPSRSLFSSASVSPE